MGDIQTLIDKGGTRNEERKGERKRNKAKKGKERRREVKWKGKRKRKRSGNRDYVGLEENERGRMQDDDESENRKK